MHVRWKKTGTDENGTTGEFQGATPLSAPEAEGFTAYEDLTKEQVLGWVQAVVVGTYEQHVNEQIQKQITKKNDPWGDVEYQNVLLSDYIDNHFPQATAQEVDAIRHINRTINSKLPAVESIRHVTWHPISLAKFSQLVTYVPAFIVCPFHSLSL